MAAPSESLPGSGDYLKATNALRGAHPLAPSSELEHRAQETLDAMWGGCSVGGAAETASLLSSQGVNTLAMSGCHESCGWESIVTSWAAETGSSACAVAHRAALLNPAAKSVGCVKREEDSCIMAVCVYDARPTDEDALQIATAGAAPACNTTACCGALPCKNTTC